MSRCRRLRGQDGFLKAALGQLQFCDAETVSGGGAVHPATATPDGCSLLAACLGRRTVCIWQLPHPMGGEGGSGGTFELAFREGYGDLLQYCWLSRRLLVAGFSTGYLVAVALSGGLQPGSGSGTELLSSRALHHSGSALSWCAATGMLAAGAGGRLALFSCALEGPEAPRVVQQPGVTELEGAHRVASLQASPCGRLLSVGTESGKLLQFLAKPPLLHGACGGKLAYVDPAASLTQALLLDTASLQAQQQQQQQQQQHRPAVPLPLPVEPELLALGPTHLAAAVGNMVSLPPACSCCACCRVPQCMLLWLLGAAASLQIAEQIARRCTLSAVLTGWVVCTAFPRRCGSRRWSPTPAPACCRRRPRQSSPPKSAGCASTPPACCC